MTPTTHLVFRQVKLAPQHPLISLELSGGNHGLVVDSLPLAQSFIQHASGFLVPQRGVVRLNSLEPCKSPALRSRIGTLLPIEPELKTTKGATSTAEYIERVQRVRNQHSSTDAVPLVHSLPPLVDALLTLPSHTLNSAQRRRLALGLALSIQDPAALILYNPLDHLDEESLECVMELLVERAKKGTLLVCITPTSRAAERLSDQVSTLTPTRSADLHARVRYLFRGEQPRQVAAYLAKSPHILATRLNPHQTQELVIESNNEEGCALALSEAIRTSQSELFELVRLPPPLTRERGKKL